jgi:3-isopropylmalate/(R)-2-methylmalate dehydratase large subunit
MFEKAWSQHVVASLGGDEDLVWIDRHFTHDLGGPFAYQALAKRNLTVRRPDLTLAIADHGISTEPGRTDASTSASRKLMPIFRDLTAEFGVRLLDVHDRRQGIVHVVGPELGLCQPGAFVVCGDSHTCTQGGVGAIAWGIGSSESVQVLATQTLIVLRPKTLLVRISGAPRAGVEAKDLVLALIARYGADGGSGYAIEYAGDAVDALSIEGRMTLCNLSVEFGARIGFVAPDEKTLAYLEGRPCSPTGPDWTAAEAHWRSLRSDPGASYDKALELDAGAVAPRSTASCRIRPPRPTPQRGRPGAPRSNTWASSRGRGSRVYPCRTCSSAPARTVATKTWSAQPRWFGDAASRRACVPGWCRDPRP